MNGCCSVKVLVVVMKRERFLWLFTGLKSRSLSSLSTLTISNRVLFDQMHPRSSASTPLPRAARSVLAPIEFGGPVESAEGSLAGGWGMATKRAID